MRINSLVHTCMGKIYSKLVWVFTFIERGRQKGLKSLVCVYNLLTEHNLKISPAKIRFQ